MSSVWRNDTINAETWRNVWLKVGGGWKGEEQQQKALKSAVSTDLALEDSEWKGHPSAFIH